MRNNKKLSYTIILLASFFSYFMFNINVKAANKPVIENASVINYKDIVRITVSDVGSGIAGYYVGSSTDITKASFISTTDTQLNLSMMNGRQYIWAKDTAGNISNPYAVTLENSCVEEAVPKNATGEGRFKKCGVYTNGTYGIVNDESIDGMCADGYSLEYLNSSNVCKTMTDNDLRPFQVGYRYCQVTFSYKCSKNNSESDKTSITSYLNSLSISSGTLSPAFNPTTYKYSASVNVSAITIDASLSGDNSSFVEGYGPKTYNLKYGLNTIYLKVKSTTGNITTYTLNITRIDNRNSDNTLSNLKTNVGKLSPEFNKGIAMYTVEVDKSVDSITVDATISNSKASFVSGYEPRTVNINSGENKIEIKVKSESGATKTYVINVIKEGSTTLENENISLLSSIELSKGKIDFDEKKSEYTVYVGYDVTQVLATPKAKNPEDKITITGGENLSVGVETPITISVYNEENNFTRIYTINVIRKEENLDISSNSKLSSLKIDNHKLKFNKDKTEYSLMLKKGVTELKINAVADDEKSIIAIDGNENLEKGSEIIIHVTAEDGSVTDYVIKITGISKGANVVLIVILIIIIIIIIGYIILRLMGYKVYFNLSIIGSFFRSIGEKIKNIFDR